MPIGDEGLDSKGLGRLRKVAQAREVWLSESSDFTPWLAEHIDVLGDELGMPLEVVATEVPVGEFRLDIKAQNANGDIVIIENQLERTDHGHLGQVLVYASGLEARVVVWVAERFRDDHRRTVDWLNERTDEDVAFFAVEVSLVQIGSGPRAPIFDVVARPNDWQKQVRTSAQSGAGGGATPANQVRQVFFVDVLTQLNERRPGVRLPAPGKFSWLAYAGGPFGNWDIAVVKGGDLRVQAYIDTENGEINDALFDQLHTEAETWQGTAGVPLTWERMDGSRACRIATYHPPVVFEDPAARAEALDWAVRAAVGMYDALNQELRERAAALRRAAARAETEIIDSSPPPL